MVDVSRHSAAPRSGASRTPVSVAPTPPEAGVSGLIGLTTHFKVLPIKLTWSVWDFASHTEWVVAALSRCVTQAIQLHCFSQLKVETTSRFWLELNKMLSVFYSM